DRVSAEPACLAVGKEDRTFEHPLHRSLHVLYGKVTGKREPLFHGISGARLWRKHDIRKADRRSVSQPPIDGTSVPLRCSEEVKRNCLEARMKAYSAIAVVAATMLLAACGTTTSDRALSGAGIGAAGGAAAGALGGSPVTGALLG